MPLHVVVHGTGHLGAAQAVWLASSGHHVVGLDVDPATVRSLMAGDPPMHEPGLRDLLLRALSTGRLEFLDPAHTDAGAIQRIVSTADVHLLCVGTPQQSEGSGADLSALRGLVEWLAPRVSPSAVLLGRSTVPVGTAADLQALVHASSAHRVELAWNPEFLREGQALEDLAHPDRIVLGATATGGRAEEIVRDLYARELAAGAPLLITDLATAELAKVAANSFLATKISFINAMADVCEVAGADVRVLAQILGADPRIGAGSLRAGLGFGGGCLPKDVRALIDRSQDLGSDTALGLLRQVDAINLGRRAHVISLVREELGGTLTGARIAALGASFKPGTSDVRDSPALDVAAAIHAEGADVIVHDPQAIDLAQRVRPELSYATSIKDALQGSDALLLLTEWPEYVALDPWEAAGWVRIPRVVDGRNVLDPERWTAAGWSYRSLGVGSGRARVRT